MVIFEYFFEIFIVVLPLFIGLFIWFIQHRYSNNSESTKNINCFYKEQKLDFGLIGRKDFTRKIKKTLKDKDTDVFYITGIPGNGKSALCYAVMNKFNKKLFKKWGILYFDLLKCCNYNDFLEVMESTLDIEQVNIDDTEIRIRKIINKLTNINKKHKYYIFFDNFQSIMDINNDTENAYEFITEINRFSQFKILISTQYAVGVLNEIKLQCLDDKNAWRLFKKINKKASVNKEEIKVFIKEQAENHPLTIVLLAALLKNNDIDNLNEVFNNDIYQKINFLKENHKSLPASIIALYNRVSNVMYCKFIWSVFAFYTNSVDIGILSEIIITNENKDAYKVKKDLEYALDEMKSYNLINTDNKYKHINMLNPIRLAYQDISKDIQEDEEGSLSFYITYLSKYFLSLLEQNIANDNKSVIIYIRDIIILQNKMIENGNEKKYKLFIDIHERMFKFYNYRIMDSVGLFISALNIGDLFNGNDDLKTRTILELANCYDYFDYDKAIAYYGEAEKISLNRDRLYAEILKRKADCYTKYGYKTEAYNTYNKAALIIKKIIDVNKIKDIVCLYAEIIKSTADIETDNDIKFELLKTALNYFREINFDCGTAYTLRALGYVYLYERDETDQSRELFNEALEIGIKEQRINAIAETYVCLANYYEKIEDHKKAKENLIKADYYFSEIVFVIPHLDCLFKLLNTYYNEHKYKKAREVIKKIYEISDNVNWNKQEEVMKIEDKINNNFLKGIFKINK